jgi:hypothetical protein
MNIFGEPIGGEPTSSSGQDINDISEELATKADIIHTHVTADVTDFETGVNGVIDTRRGENNGLAPLNGSGFVETQYLPNLVSLDYGTMTSSGETIAMTGPLTTFQPTTSMTGGATSGTTFSNQQLVVNSNADYHINTFCNFELDEKLPIEIETAIFINGVKQTTFSMVSFH